MTQDSSSASSLQGSNSGGTTVFRPTKPKFGDVVEVGTDLWAAWTGGKPRADWSGLEEPDPTNVSPNMYRPSSIYSQAKSRPYRIQGLETKFGKEDDLQTFERQVMKHLTTHGMDTITYLQNPTEAGEVVSVVTGHGLFTAKEGIKAGNDVKNDTNKFDKYCHENDTDAKEFLLNSVNESLEKQLYEDSLEDDSFVALWFHLIRIVRSTSIDRFESIKTRIKGRSIANYAGEDVQALCSDYFEDWQELHSAKMYDFNLTSNMLTEIMKAGGNNEDFRFELRTMKSALTKKLLAIRHKEYQEKHADLVADELDVRSILNRCKEEYRTLLDKGQWPAAVHAKDSKALNKNFGNVNLALSKQLKNFVNALVQNSNQPSRDKSKDKCRNCGQTGHWAKDCPKPTKDSKSGNGRKSNKKPNQGRSKTPGTRTPPPKPGESEIKFIDGVKKYWCAKCNRWTLSHGTSGHKSKEELKTKPAANAAKVSFDFHPAAFMVKEYFEESPKPNWLRTIKNLTIIMWFLLSAGSLGYFGWHLLTSQALAPLMSSFWNLMLTGAEAASVNWVSVLMFFMSGGIGFGTAVIAYNTSDDWAKEPKVRYRRGVAALKQARRRNKDRRISRRYYQKVPSSAIPNIELRESLKYRVKFNNFGRPSRHSPPKEVMIKQVKRQINILDREIAALRELLREKVITKNQLMRELVRLERGPRESVFRRPRGFSRAFHHAPIFSLRDPVPTRRSRKMEAKKKNNLRRKSKSVNTKVENVKPKGPRLLKNFSCAVANLVNLGRISSSEPNSGYDGSVLFDSGANCCITNRKEDFTGEFVEGNCDHSVDGIGTSLKVRGRGTVAWTFEGDNGMYRTLRLPCYYIPSSLHRVASLQRVLEVCPEETFLMNGQCLVLSGTESVPSISIPYCPRSNLPLATPLDHAHDDTDPQERDHLDSGADTARLEVNRCAASTNTSRTPKPQLPINKSPMSSLTHPDNLNLSGPEKELLRWHYRLGHIGVKRVQWMFRQGILATSEATRRMHSAACKITHGPLCTACQYAKQRRKTMPGHSKIVHKEEQNSLKFDDLFPGKMISVDHFYAGPDGRLDTTYGKEHSDKKRKGGAIFVDHASGNVFTYFQSHLNSHETLEAKKAFETFCTGCGVVPQNYLSDNGTSFVSKDYTAHLEQFHQTTRLSGVGAHHSNGIAERSIGTILSIARAMMHHSALHWPDVADTGLWPLAVQHAVYIFNRIPQESSGRSPYELFTRRAWPASKFQDFHVWGCPVYVLDSALHSGNSVPRWKARSSRGMYVGNSTKHGHAVPRVLNLETGAITSQYHVVFDDEFQTVDSSISSQVDFDHDDWYKTFGLTPQQYVREDDLQDPVPDVPPPVSVSEGVDHLERARSVRDQAAPPQPIPVPSQPLQRSTEPEPKPLPSSPSLTPPLQEALESPPPLLQREKNTIEVAPSKPTATEPAPPVEVKAPPPSTPTPSAKPKPKPAPSRMTTRSQTSPPMTRSRAAAQVKPWQAESNYVEAYGPIYDLFVGKANKKNSDPDTYTWDEAMASPHREEFLKAADAEIQALVDKEPGSKISSPTLVLRSFPTHGHSE